MTPDVEVPAGDAFDVAYRAALEDVCRLDPDSPAAAEAQQALQTTG